MEKTILVIGGTGMLGQPVAHSLKEAGFQVRIMTRDTEKARKKFDDSFEIITGDPLDINFLKKALDSCFGVHISLASEVEQAVAEKVAQLAANSGIERITYVSGATVAEETRWYGMVNRKFLAEQAIRTSGTSYTIFCPTWFMESLPLFVRNSRASVIGKQACPYHWVAAEDFARMVSRAYRLEAAANRRFIIHGPQAIRMNEALKRYCAVFQPEIKQVSTMPIWLVKLMATLTRNPELKSVGEMMAYFDKVGEGRYLANTSDVLGTPTTTLAEWLEWRKAILSAANVESQLVLS